MSTIEQTQDLSDHDQHVFLARLCEHAGRHDDMLTEMNAVIASAQELTLDERNLLSVAYKNVIGNRRASWRILLALESREATDLRETDPHKLELLQAYKRDIEAELRRVCDQVLEVLEVHLIPNSKDSEAEVFYYKLKGDYWRYIAEFTEGDERKRSAASALEAYQQASNIAQKAFSSTHPLRLGLALNFSVFYYEILNSWEKACELAKQAFDDAIPELDALPDHLYPDSKLIMQLLRNNLTFWQNDVIESLPAKGEEINPAVTPALSDATDATADSSAETDSKTSRNAGKSLAPALVSGSTESEAATARAIRD